MIVLFYGSMHMSFFDNKNGHPSSYHVLIKEQWKKTLNLRTAPLTKQRHICLSHHRFHPHQMSATVCANRYLSQGALEGGWEHGMRVCLNCLPPSENLLCPTLYLEQIRAIFSAIMHLDFLEWIISFHVRLSLAGTLVFERFLKNCRTFRTPKIFGEGAEGTPAPAQVTSLLPTFWVGVWQPQEPLAFLSVAVASLFRPALWRTAGVTVLAQGIYGQWYCLIF